jgi:copper oxidase (laccase) domain-containing protein
VAASVGPNTLESLCNLTRDAASDVIAVVGPHISPESYEVGDEVVEGILGSGVPREEFVFQRRKAHVSLFAAVRYQLERAGVGRVVSVGGCTFREPRFFSHRREGPATGRLASVIARPPEGDR